MEAAMEMNHAYQTISTEQLGSLLAQQPETILIDTLLNDHFALAHLPGARNACVYQVDFLDQITALASEKSTAIVLYGADAHTMDADTAAQKLMRIGYTKVRVLKGGLTAWHAAGLPLEGSLGRPPASISPLPALVDGVYPVDQENSIIEWAGRNPNSKHHGILKLAEGQVTVQQGEITGEFTVDMTSIENLNLKGDELYQVLIDHLKSDDFFFVDRFPQAKFSMKSAQPMTDAMLGMPNFRVKGVFELRGVNADLAFDATINTNEEGGLMAQAHFDMDRTRWEVIYGSSRFFKHLGMHLVYDLISLELRILTLTSRE